MRCCVQLHTVESVKCFLFQIECRRLYFKPYLQSDETIVLSKYSWVKERHDNKWWGTPCIKALFTLKCTQKNSIKSQTDWNGWFSHPHIKPKTGICLFTKVLLFQQIRNKLYPDNYNNVITTIIHDQPMLINKHCKCNLTFAHLPYFMLCCVNRI